LLDYGWPGNIRELKNVVERLVVRGFNTIHVDDLPEELRLVVSSPRAAAAGVEATAARADDLQPAAAESVANILWRRLQTGESFWACVADPFRSHDLTRADLRALVRRGLDETHGSYRNLLRTFNLADDDYKRLLAFLRQHDCHVPFQQFRAGKPLRIASALPSESARAVR
jgi:DNA-binding NtrC family response regulator